MWEILHGKSIFYGQNFGHHLQSEICNNDLRPDIIKSSPKCYVSLMKMCWNKDPEKRPSAVNIHEIFTEWHNNIKVLLESSESEKIMHDIEIMNVPMYSISYKTSFYRDSELNQLGIVTDHNEIRLKEI
ncbi:hypothetical protein C2G38_2090840 [Gigaspora rosea]|uniref:Serine-threonine/tyrosine-protein kinase catalytic domain-containing protein n=1 Tax=Gigaspora rosea TaxID=44941 RepID=A0A397V1R5_9GLOM|nr:hypothetical protein C2G38_2090840 [Gigaspora rosea]